MNDLQNNNNAGTESYLAFGRAGSELSEQRKDQVLPSLVPLFSLRRWLPAAPGQYKLPDSRTRGQGALLEAPETITLLVVGSDWVPCLSLNHGTDWSDWLVFFTCSPWAEPEKLRTRVSHGN